jgi:hypothetical protein
MSTTTQSNVHTAMVPVALVTLLCRVVVGRDSRFNRNKMERPSYLCVPVPICGMALCNTLCTVHALEVERQVVGRNGHKAA